MESPDYVARRILFDLCDIITPIDARLEPIYDALLDWMERYTEAYGGDIYHRLPGDRMDRDELLSDMSQLYAGIFARVDNSHSITTLRSLFTVTFYMTVKYKEHPALCSDIVQYFTWISRRLGSWNILEDTHIPIDLQIYL